MTDFFLIADMGRPRSKDLLNLLGPGLERQKLKLRTVSSTFVPKKGDVIFWWGMPGWAKPFHETCLAAGAVPVVFDLGYWARATRTREGGGYLKVSPLHWHPNPLVMQYQMPPDRYRASAPAIKPPREPGRYITVASMSEKSASTYGLRVAEAWDSDTIREIRTKLPDTPICYRVKPSWREGDQVRIVGVSKYSLSNETVTFVLDNSKAVVCHHSNVGVDALIHGVPAFSRDGAVSAISPYTGPGCLRDPKLPDNREQFLHNLAYFNWSPQEIKEGLVWPKFREMGLISY